MEQLYGGRLTQGKGGRETNNWKEKEWKQEEKES